MVQKRIRGNHLALVEKSRMDVAVMDHATDHMTVTINHTGDELMDGQTVNTNQNKSTEATGKDSITLTSLASQIEKLTTVVAGIAQDQKETKEKMSKDNYMDKDKKMAKDDDKDKKAEDEDKKKMAKDDEHDKKAEDKDKDKKNGMDEAIKSAIDAAVAPLLKQIDGLEKAQSAMDSASLMREFTERDKLAAQLSRHIGTFDHSTKTLQEVAKYGVEKLGVPTTDGQEIAAITAYLHNRPVDRPLYAVATAQDGSTNDPVDSYVGGNK